MSISRSNYFKQILYLFIFFLVFSFLFVFCSMTSFAFDTNTDNADWSGCPEYDDSNYQNCDDKIHSFWDPSISGSGKEIAHVAYRVADSNNKALNINYLSFTYDSNTLVYFYFNSYSGNEVLGIQNVSRSNIIWQMKGFYSYNWSNPVYTNSSPSFNNSVNVNISAIPHIEILYSDVDIADFHNVSNVNTAISNYFNGDTSCLIASKDDFSTKFDGETLKLGSYNVKYFDADDLKNVYTDFKFTLPDDMDKTGVYLDVDTSYKIILQNNIGFVDVGLPDKVYSSTKQSDFQIYPSGSTGGLGASAGVNTYRSYVKDLTPIKNYQSDLSWWNALVIAGDQSDREILGKANWWCMDRDGHSYKTTLSQVTYKVTVCKGNIKGMSYYFTFDLLGGMSASFSTKPNDKGEESYNNDVTYTGNYTIKETVDSMGNPQNTYTYTPPNSTVNIDSNTGEPVTGGSSADGVINVMGTINVVGSVGSGDSDNVNVTIEDDDYTRDTLIETIKSGYGLLDNTDTGEKGDGLLAMISALMGGINADIPAMFGFGISSVVTISILRSLFKR